MGLGVQHHRNGKVQNNYNFFLTHNLLIECLLLIPFINPEIQCITRAQIVKNLTNPN
jgi:hypothetical protein